MSADQKVQSIRIDTEAIREGGTACRSAANRAYAAQRPALLKACEGHLSRFETEASQMSRELLIEKIEAVNVPSLSRSISAYTTGELIDVFARIKTKATYEAAEIERLKALAKREQYYAEWINHCLDKCEAAATAIRLASKNTDTDTGTAVSEALHSSRVTRALHPFARTVVASVDAGSDIHQAAETAIVAATATLMEFPVTVQYEGSGVGGQWERTLDAALGAREFIQETARILHLRSLPLDGPRTY